MEAVAGDMSDTLVWRALASFCWCAWYFLVFIRRSTLKFRLLLWLSYVVGSVEFHMVVNVVLMVKVCMVLLGGEVKNGGKFVYACGDDKWKME